MLGSGLLLGAGIIGFVAVQEVECRLGQSTIVHQRLDTIESERQALHDIAIAGITPSPDARSLFEEFAKRFSLIEATGERERTYDLRKIIISQGGDRDELIFALLTLFASNGIDAESVGIYGSSEAVRKRNIDDIKRVVVYAPVQDRIFDPTLPAIEQHQGSGRAVIGRMPRVHDARVTLSIHECRSFFR